jgi:hypothetical protein
MNWSKYPVSISLSVVVAMLLFSFLSNGMNTAAAQTTMPGMTEVSGKYTNENEGVEIVFPDGWTGFETSYTGTVAASVIEPTTKNSDFPKIITLAVVPKAQAKTAEEAKQTMEAQSDVKCSDPSTSDITLSGKPGKQYTMDCTRADGTSYKIKGAYVMTESRMVSIVYMAKTADFAADEGKFDAALKTVKVEGVVDTGGSTNLGLELKSVIQSVLVKGKNVDLSLKTTSTISNFKLEEQDKKMTFTVDGQSGTQGTTEIPIGQVLEGPYMVAIDGQSTTNFEVTNEGTSNAMMKLSYSHSTHDITISGTNVVPEFPVVAIGAVAAVVGIVAIMGRTSLFRNGLL